jgi:two-component system, OmpR family, phosphate regulon sensor histidine kinase PhoR
MTTPDGGWLHVNDAFCKLLGYNRDELFRLTIADITHPDDRSFSEKVWRKEVGGLADAERYEKRYVRADGEVIWGAITSTIVCDEDGEPLHTLAHIEDITERHKAQVALEEAGARFRAAFDYAPTSMAVVALGGELLRVNQAFCNLLGATEAELLGTNYRSYTPAESLEERVAGIDRVISGEIDIDTVETQLRRSDGTLIWVTRSVSCVRDADGEPLYLLPQITDIGERKQAERETARLLLLEREHVERLQSVDKLKDEFVAAVSHELRTPLTSILGYLELALDEDTGALNEEQRKYLETVGRNSERLLLLVGDLLSVAQAEGGQLELHLAELDLSALVLESVDSARPSAAAKNIRLEHAAEKLQPYQGDHVRLAQLLDNLVSNAVKFTPEGGRVSVTLAEIAGAAVLEVTDTGIGIPVEEQAHVFERFFRSEGATRGAIQGTGLGLSISRTIAESHGGSISFESADGAGTTFRVELPLADRPQA